MSNQLTINFEPSLPERYRPLREFLAYRVMVQAKPLKSIAADMDMSPSLLSRKLNPGDADTQRFNLDDLEQYLDTAGDAAAVVEYLAAKYLQGDEARKAQALARVELLAKDLERALSALKGDA